MAYKSKEARSENDKKYNAREDVKKRRAAKFKEWRNQNRERLRKSEAARRLSKRGQCLVSDARTRARKRDIIFNLDAHISDIQKRIDIGRCEVTGIAFDLSPGLKWNSPSLDRMDPQKGYVIENIRVVLHAMNSAMGQWGEAVVWQMFQGWSLNKSKGLI